MSDILRFNFEYQEKSRTIQVAAEKNSGKLIVSCYGFFGQEDTVPDYKWDYIMDEGDYDKLMMIIKDAHALRWEATYLDESVEDGTIWSLEIHQLGKHTFTDGYNKFPPEFKQFFDDMIGFLRLKRRQIHPGVNDLRNISIAEQAGEACPIVMADNMEKTFTFYNLFDSIENDGTYFMRPGDWEEMVAIISKHYVFDKFADTPAPKKDADSQCSISLGYKPGNVTDRHTGYQPAWWGDFSKEMFDHFRAIYKAGRKPADKNIGAIPSQ